jgi:hypothetical protein
MSCSKRCPLCILGKISLVYAAFVISFSLTRIIL